MFGYSDLRFGEQVRVRGVVHMSHVHTVQAGPDDAEFAGPGAGDDARHEMVVAGTPDQVRPQGAGAKHFGIGGEHEAFGLGLGHRYAAAGAFPGRDDIGQRFVGAGRATDG